MSQEDYTPNLAPFGGRYSDEYNALWAALWRSAEQSEGKMSEHVIYDYLQRIPKTSLTVGLVDALHELGFEIKKIDR